MSTSLCACPSHHKAATDIGLEDFIKRTLGVGATVEGEDLRHVTHAVLIMASAFDRQQCILGFVGIRLLACGAGRVEHHLRLQGQSVAFWVAGVVHCLRVTLRLRERSFSKKNIYCIFIYFYTVSFSILYFISVVAGTTILFTTYCTMYNHVCEK